MIIGTLLSAATPIAITAARIRSRTRMSTTGISRTSAHCLLAIARPTSSAGGERTLLERGEERRRCRGRR